MKWSILACCFALFLCTSAQRNQSRNLPVGNMGTMGHDTFGRQSAQLNNQENFQMNSQHLRFIRSELLYPFFDKGPGTTDTGDYQTAIKDNTPHIQKNLNFLLPFFGFGFNYTWVSLHGHIAFSDSPPVTPHYPLEFPMRDYPEEPDPSFIGPFYSKCKIGRVPKDIEDIDKREYGVYFRVEHNLPSRTDRFGVELRERSKWDIREGIIGAEAFEPRHILIVTWKNVTFAGGYGAANTKTNTIQLVIVTDEVRTYAMFNYKHISWTSHPEAGGSSEDGSGGTPAFIGFNAGNGTRAFEYKPFSQGVKIMDILSSGGANEFPERHIFRIDEKIHAAQCTAELYDMGATDAELFFAPESGNMLGGTIVNVTGPCFNREDRINCRFNTHVVQGSVIDGNRAMCVMPLIYATGYIDLHVEVEGRNLVFKGRFLVETPFSAPELVSFPHEEHLEPNPESLNIWWDYKNLTTNRNVPVSITLWGYREEKINPEIVFLKTLADGVPNTGEYLLSLASILSETPEPWMMHLGIGLITVNITNPSDVIGQNYAPVLWSRPIPLSWYLYPHWRHEYGRVWSEAICEKWLLQDRLLKNFAGDLPMCPCNLQQAVADKGRFLPDPNCDMDGKVHNCYLHKDAKHCVRSSMPSQSGGGQQCCYDIEGNLMMTYDQKWGGRPARSHDYGLVPWNEASKVPSLSHYLHDIAPFFPCCMWEHDQSWWCMTLRFERRVSQNCVGYQPPGVATVFGDPHIVTFDGQQYTFNGLGEFVLVRSNTDRHKFDVQGRFEQVVTNDLGPRSATVMTTIAAKENASVTVEIRLRPAEAQWRYKLDVIVDQHRIFFDRFPQKIQTFAGVTVFTPTKVLNQSHVIAMFESGAGVEVVENKGHMSVRVYLPRTYLNQTTGLFGNWSGLIEDDFVTPSGEVGPTGSINNLQQMHRFGLEWMIEDSTTEQKGSSLFYHENGRVSSDYNHYNFQPIMQLDPRNILLPNVTLRPEEVERFCGASYQCKYDYSVTLNKDFAHWTKFYLSEFNSIRTRDLAPITSCGALMTPIHGRKSTFKFTPGTEVHFDCDPDFVLEGERRRRCLANGEWSSPEEGGGGDPRTETEWLNWNPSKATRCIEAGEHDSVAAGKTAGIVLGILIPLALLLFCLTAMYKSSRDSRKNDYTVELHNLPQSNYEPHSQEAQAMAPLNNRPEDIVNLSSDANRKQSYIGLPQNKKIEELKAQSEVRNLSKPPRKGQLEQSNESSGPDGPSPREGTYYTGEPLPGRPTVEFYPSDTDGDKSLGIQSPKRSYVSEEISV